MRTSAKKKFSLGARIEKEISLSGDRARRAQNFARIRVDSCDRARPLYEPSCATSNFSFAPEFCLEANSENEFFYAIEKNIFDRAKLARKLR
jgi:hypothetical protein